MQALTYFIFLTGIAFLFIHELDEVHQNVWHFLFPKRTEETAYRINVVVRLFMFLLIMWYAPNTGFQIGLDVFLIAHVGIHWYLRNHPKIMYNSAFALFWVFGAGVFGAVHLAMLAL